MQSMRDFSRRGQRVRMAVLLSSDLVAMFLSWFVAAIIASSIGKADWTQLFPPATPGGTVFTLMSLAVVISLAASGQYGRRSAFWEETRIVWRQIVTVALINFALNFFLQVSFTRVLALGAWVLALGFLPMGRLLSRELLLGLGLWRRRALLVGCGETSSEAESAIRREQHMGLEIISTVDPAAYETEDLPAAVADWAE